LAHRSRVLCLLAVTTATLALACAREKTPATDDVPLTGVASFGVQARDHVDSNVTYPQTPPVGGAHNPTWQNCGIYAEPIRKELGVHSMEHGAVWITYRPDLPAADVETLRAVVKGWPFTLLTPYPDLPGPVYASAWGVQLRADSAADPRLGAFLKRYVNGEQTPEPGAPCSNGEGKPIG
jgi:hypothetical protein